MTTELVVRTLSFEPAKIEFNFDQLSAILDENLKKYEGLEFTEKTAGDCKKTIAELRKGKRLLDTYRKDTKKELSVAITAFEDQCKELAAKFDAVIDPLTQQYEQFEHDRIQRKLREIEEIASNLIQEQGLRDKFADELMAFPEEYFNKTKAMKDIKSELTARAESLGIAQDKEDADIQLIKTNVELANAKHQLAVGLVDTAYICLLEHESIDSIVEKINADAETLKQRESDLQQKFEETEKELKPTTPKPPAGEEQFVETYEIEGTEAQLDALEEFLETNSFTWKIVE